MSALYTVITFLTDRYTCLLYDCPHSSSLFFFFTDTATTEIYTLSLHDALPISCRPTRQSRSPTSLASGREHRPDGKRSEEHTSELQSRGHLVCRLLLEKKKKKLDKQLIHHVYDHAKTYLVVGHVLISNDATSML